MLSYHDHVATFQCEFLTAALREHQGDHTKTAEALGLQRTYLLKLIRKHGITVPRTAPRAPASERRCGMCRERGHDLRRHLSGKTA